MLLWFAFSFVLTQKERLEVPHRKVMLCATPSGEGLKKHITAVFNLIYFHC